MPVASRFPRGSRSPVTGAPVHDLHHTAPLLDVQIADEFDLPIDHVEARITRVARTVRSRSDRPVDA